MNTLLLLILLLISSSLSLFGQTKVWEATSPTTTIDYLTISQDGSTLVSVYGDSLYIWKTSDTSFMKKVVFTINSNPTISRFNEKVYCSGKVNNVAGLYTIPINEDTLYFNKLVEFPDYMGDGYALSTKGTWTLISCVDTNSLVFSYNYGSLGSNIQQLGRTGLITSEAKQTSNSNTNSIARISCNPFTNQIITTGNSREIPARGGPYTDHPHLGVYSISAGKPVYSIGKEYTSIGACRDSNYIVLEGQLFHIPSKNYLRTFPTELVGNYNSSSFTQDFFVGIKGTKSDTITIVRYDRDTAELKIYCGGTINNLQLSADSRRIAVITSGKSIAVYELPEIAEQAALHVDFTSDFKKPYKGGSIQFRNNSYITDSKYKILWEFGDGDTSSLLHPMHTYSKPGRYTVRLTIKTSIGDSASLAKTDYIIYEDIVKPIGALWAKKYINAGITALTFVKDSVFAGTNDGSIFSMKINGDLGRLLVKNANEMYRFINETNYQSNVLYIKEFTYHENSETLYSIGVPKGISSQAFLYKFRLPDGSPRKKIEIGVPGYTPANIGGGARFNENNSDGGFASISLNSDSTHLQYSNYGSVSYSWNGGPPPNNIFGGESKGNYAGTLLVSKDTIEYDNGRSPYIGTYPVNPLYSKTAFALCYLKVYSIRGGLPYNPNSYFVIANNNVHHIRYGTFDLIAKFPTKGTILRHSPDQYHSFTSDGVWSFTDGKRLDSLPLLSARSFEVFPDGVHLLVMYPKSDTVGIFNTLTKKYMQYFKANFIISSIAISKDGKSFATGDTGGIVTLWQTPKLSIAKKLDFITIRIDKKHINGDTLQFFNTSTPLNTTCRYTWEFGDGATSEEHVPTHVFGKAGIYTVALRIICPTETAGDSTVDVVRKQLPVLVADTATAVEFQQPVKLSNLTIIPNPATRDGRIVVRFSQPEQFSMNISSVLGRQMYSFFGVSSFEQFPIAPLPNGIYTCQLRFGNGEIITRPFIVIE